MSPPRGGKTVRLVDTCVDESAVLEATIILYKSALYHLIKAKTALLSIAVCVCILQILFVAVYWIFFSFEYMKSFFDIVGSFNIQVYFDILLYCFVSISTSTAIVTIFSAICYNKFLFLNNVALNVTASIIGIFSVTFWILTGVSAVRDFDTKMTRSLEWGYISEESFHSSSTAWNLIQAKTGKCGIKDPTDWQNSMWFARNVRNPSFHHWPWYCCPEALKLTTADDIMEHTGRLSYNRRLMNDCYYDSVMTTSATTSWWTTSETSETTTSLTTSRITSPTTTQTTTTTAKMTTTSTNPRVDWENEPIIRVKCDNPVLVKEFGCRLYTKTVPHAALYPIVTKTSSLEDAHYFCKERLKLSGVAAGFYMEEIEAIVEVVREEIKRRSIKTSGWERILLGMKKASPDDLEPPVYFNTFYGFTVTSESGVDKEWDDISPNLEDKDEIYSGAYVKSGKRVGVNKNDICLSVCAKYFKTLEEAQAFEVEDKNEGFKVYYSAEAGIYGSYWPDTKFRTKSLALLNCEEKYRAVLAEGFNEDELKFLTSLFGEDFSSAVLVLGMERAPTSSVFHSDTFNKPVYRIWRQNEPRLQEGYSTGCTSLDFAGRQACFGETEQYFVCANYSFHPAEGQVPSYTEIFWGQKAKSEQQVKSFDAESQRQEGAVGRDWSEDTDDYYIAINRLLSDGVETDVKRKLNTFLAVTTLFQLISLTLILFSTCYSIRYMWYFEYVYLRQLMF